MDSYQDVSFGPLQHHPWNKGRLIGPKSPLKPREIWAVRIRLQMRTGVRDLAMFNLALDSKLRGCDLVNLRGQDIAHSGKPVGRASIVQQKTHQPVKFELTEQTQPAVEAWIAEAGLTAGQYLFPSRQAGAAHISTRQYARIVKGWLSGIGLDASE